VQAVTGALPSLARTPYNYIVMRAVLMWCHKVLSRLHPSAVLALTVSMILLFSYWDYQTQYEIAISLLLLLPITLVTWYVGYRTGLLLSVLSVLLWLTLNTLSGRTYTHEFIRYLNTLLRLFLLTGIVWLLHELKLAMLHEHTQSHTDHQTGLPNSREFYSQAEREIERMRRHPAPLSLAYMDADNFKQVNDHFGHSTGDQLLKALAEVVTAVIRRNDLFARIGGDEFVLLLPDTDPQAARSTLQKVEIAILVGMKSLPARLTLSIGVVTFHTAPSSVDAMLQEVDGLMYQAKSEGKNRILYDQH
jgi:diguanylate cyclase (GGDEF)-like protein